MTPISNYQQQPGLKPPNHCICVIVDRYQSAAIYLILDSKTICIVVDRYQCSHISKKIGLKYVQFCIIQCRNGEIIGGDSRCCWQISQRRQQCTNIYTIQRHMRRYHIDGISGGIYTQIYAPRRLEQIPDVRIGIARDEQLIGSELHQKIRIQLYTRWCIYRPNYIYMYHTVHMDLTLYQNVWVQSTWFVGPTICQMVHMGIYIYAYIWAFSGGWD